MSVRPGEPLSGRLGDYDALGARLPEGMETAYDGMVVEARAG